jgi:hypothetical protein
MSLPTPFPPERGPAQPLPGPFTQEPLTQLPAPVFNPHAVVYPGESLPAVAALTPPPHSGGEQDMPETSPTIEQSSAPRLHVAKNVGPIAVQESFVGSPEALQRFEKFMASDMPPQKLDDALWWIFSRQSTAYAKLEQTKIAEAEKPWPVADSGITTGDLPFSLTFDRVLPRGVSMQRDIERNVADVRQPKVVGVELGGVGRIFKDVELGTFDASYSISLSDYRRALENGDQIIADDEARHHKVITGNMFRQETLETLKAELGGIQPAYIAMRMKGGQYTLPREVIGMTHFAAAGYKMLANRGLMHVEVPFAFGPFFHEWLDALAQHPALSVTPGIDDSGKDPLYIMRLHKRPGSPEDFPVIPPRSFVPHYRAVIEQRRQRIEQLRRQQEDILKVPLDFV